MVHYAAFLTLFLAAVALAQDNSRNGPKYVTLTRTKTKTITVTKTVETCLGSPKPGEPTSVPSSGVEPTSTSTFSPELNLGLSSLSVDPLISRSSLISPHSFPTSSPTLPISSLPSLNSSIPSLTSSIPSLTSSPSSLTPSPTPTSGSPEGDDDDEDCGDDEEGDNTSSMSILPVDSSVKPTPTSSYSLGFSDPPATFIDLSSSSVSPPVPSSTEHSSSEPAPVPSNSMLSSPASSVISSTGAPKPTSTVHYDRNAICGNQKREPSPLEAAPKLSKRVLRRRITY